jgi:ribonuclease P protein component
MEEFTFTKAERLCNRDDIDALFKKGNEYLFAAPFRFVWIKINPADNSHCKVIIVCPKKRFKRAHTRNRIRRQIREFYRINKNPLIQTLQKNETQIGLAIFYQGPETMDFHICENIFVKALEKIASNFEKNT